MIRPIEGNAAVFDSPAQQLEAELRWVLLRLRVIVERSRQRRSIGPPPEYRGLYITDEEVDDLLSREAGDSTAGQLIAEATALRRQLDESAAAALDAGLALPLDRIARDFGLSAAERRVLVVALAPELDSTYEKVYAYVNDDITKRWPTVGLALDVLDDEAPARLDQRRLFFHDAPLVRHNLIVTGEHGPVGQTLPNRQFSLDPHVAEVLLGYKGLDPRLHGLARSVGTEQSETTAGEALAQALGQRLDSRVYIGGRWQAEKEQAIAGACALLGLNLVSLSMPALSRTLEPGKLLSLALRDARLLNAALMLEGYGGQDSDLDLSLVAGDLVTGLEDHPLPVFLCDRASTPAHLPFDLHLQFDYPMPAFEARQKSWRLAGGIEPDEAVLLAAMYRLGAREVRSTVEMARSLAHLEGRDSTTLGDLKQAARTQSQPRLTSLAQKITPHYTWDDIVLPDDRMAQLREIANQVLYQHVVYEDWGLAGKSTLGRGVAALFAGQSGTGKTMAADVIANDLGLDVYKIDLSGLVSKYIGETEKNLARVFEEASDTNAILFFDEADAVFGKRSEVRDSHDRYANIEVSYLLQKMEEYDGIVILATNLRANLDEAFLRRMRAIVEFPFPEVEDRLRIWQRTLSPGAPLAKDVDLQFMAHQFRIAGGNIRNIVLLAAFLAASEEAPIGMTHLIHGAKREYQKLGRLIAESDFGRWLATAHE
ncbi:MAG: AAA family ATPase [Dehalococcoidia bacterium]|nr:AAA family ATPase [Dehalococcoidia bacterium]